MNKLEIIRQLEILLDSSFTKVDICEITKFKLDSASEYSIDLQGNITGLCIANFDLSEIPNVLIEKENVFSLQKSLTHLNLSSNKIFIISNLKYFKNLASLDLRHNKISDISVINQFENISELKLYNNRISDISTIDKLNRLTILYLSDNKISDISILKNFIKLKILYLSDNLISDISILKYLKNLTTLYLDNNVISDYSFLKDLKNLTTLYLNYDKISDYSFLSELTKLTSPSSEIVKQGDNAIRNYFKSIIRKKRPLNELKLIFVGDGSAGKTSLMKRLIGTAFDKNEKQTHGINIVAKEFTVNKETTLKVNMWDFGGQEIMHSVHHFFLSKRSLYILVLDGRKEEKTEYWLKHIENFGSDSPVIIVLNKYDEHKGADINRKFLQDKYKNIKDFAHISCLSGYGVEDLTEKIIAKLSEVKATKTLWGRNWFKVKQELEKNTENYISIDDYIRICENNFIKKQREQDVLLSFLNDLGIMLHFKDLALQDTSVLNPKWLTTAVYRIINSQKVKNNNGELDINSLKEILLDSSEYPRSKYNYIIEIMRKFELCYNVSENTLLLPNLLPVQEPNFSMNSKEDKLLFILKYDFFPKSIMPRFIVNSNEEIKDKIRWRTGVLLQSINYDAIALVKADEEDKKIIIEVIGIQKRDYFAIIRNTLKHINNSFNRLKVEELIPLPGFSNYTIDYEELIGFEQDGRKEYYNGKLRKVFSVKELLDGVVSEEQRKEEQQKANTNITNNYISIKGDDNIIGQNVKSDDFSITKNRL